MMKEKTKRNYGLVEDDRWKRKGVPHLKKGLTPEICPNCGGLGFMEFSNEQDRICLVCLGEGVVYD